MRLNSLSNSLASVIDFPRLIIPFMFFQRCKIQASIGIFLTHHDHSNI